MYMLKIMLCRTITSNICVQFNEKFRQVIRLCQSSWKPFVDMAGVSTSDFRVVSWY